MRRAVELHDAEVERFQEVARSFVGDAPADLAGMAARWVDGLRLAISGALTWTLKVRRYESSRAYVEEGFRQIASLDLAA